MSKLLTDSKELVSVLDSFDITEALNDRVVVKEVPPNQIIGASKFGAENVIGTILFGSSNLERTVAIDKNYKFDKKLTGSKFVARVENDLTKLVNGFIHNASLIKLNLSSGTIALADEEDVDQEGDLRFQPAFKFKKLYITNTELAKKLGWI